MLPLVFLIVQPLDHEAMLDGAIDGHVDEGGAAAMNASIPVFFFGLVMAMGFIVNTVG
jgi:hypothetical protein